MTDQYYGSPWTGTCVDIQINFNLIFVVSISNEIYDFASGLFLGSTGHRDRERRDGRESEIRTRRYDGAFIVRWPISNRTSTENQRVGPGISWDLSLWWRDGMIGDDRGWLRRRNC